MKFWLIFKHAIKQLIGNGRVVGQIILPAIIIDFAVNALISQEFLFMPFETFQRMEKYAYLSDTVSNQQIEKFIPFVVQTILGLSVAVLWHRYVLLNERPTMARWFQPGRMFAYFLTGILLFLPIIVTSTLFFLSFSFLSYADKADDGLLFSLIPFGLSLLLVILFMVWFRLATVLPGVALGAKTSVREIWTKTKGQKFTFFGLGVVLVVMTGLLNIEISFYLNLPLMVSISLRAISTYLQTIIFLSVLTTLYGHYIQGRALVR